MNLLCILLVILTLSFLFVSVLTLCNNHNNHQHHCQRRAFLSSSDEGMLETFTKYCHTTMNEIVDAAFRYPFYLISSPPTIHSFDEYKRIVYLQMS